MVKDKPKLKKGERYCQKCEKVVKSVDFNNYYGICFECQEKSTGH